MREPIIYTGEWDPFEPFAVYLHSNRDSYLEVELDPANGAERFAHVVHQGLHYLGYEVEVLYLVNMETGTSELLAVREGQIEMWRSGVTELDNRAELWRRGRENGTR